MPVEWDRPFTLRSPEGELEFNVPTTSPYTSNANYLFLLDHARCRSGPGALRTTVDNLAQRDGSSIHPSFKPGYGMTLVCGLWVTNDAESDLADGRAPACYTDRRVMWDTFALHAQALLNPSLSDEVSNARIFWSPSGAEDRMLHKIRTMGWPSAADEDILTVVTYEILSPYPYEMDHAESPGGTVPATIEEGFPITVTNTGSTDAYPVFKIFGPVSPEGAFAQIENATTGKSIYYDTALPGAHTISGGDYVEIDCFRDTAYLNGSGALRKSGIDATLSDFFTLVPGDNELHFFGGSPGYVEVTWNNAWA